MSNSCQSCAMPLNKDPKQGGSNADGSLSTEYCSHCFENGAFTQPGFDVQQMQDFCIQKMKDCGVPKPLGWLFTRGLPKLKRWSTQ